MKLKISIAGEEKVYDLLHDIKEKAGNLEPPLRDLGERLRRRISKRLSGDVLKRQTGRLEGSSDVDVETHGLKISYGGRGKAGDIVRYALIHHQGGVIRPEKAKALTIPFPGGPADVSMGRTPRRASDFKDTFVAKGIIFQKIGEDEIQPVFILKKQVTLPARPYAYIEDSDIDYLKRSIREYILGEW